jgi:predicted AAA+ superfamily ATPase
LDLFEQYLLDVGVNVENIVRMNFESLEFDNIRDYKALNEYVTARIIEGNKTYVLMDEVQIVTDWERAVNSFRLNSKLDLYITGSNSRLLSSELSTLLSGRYIEIHMLPLSFREFLDFNDFSDEASLQEHFNLFIERGGLPGITELRDIESAIAPYLNGIYNTILIKDVVMRGEVRDPALLENVARFIAGQIGNPISSKKISDYLTSGGRKTASETVDNYLHLLENAYVFYRAARYALKGKQQLKTQGKYYIVDTGIRGELVGMRGQDYGSTLENIVFFELLRRGFDVKIGSLSGLEIDFVATKPATTIYYQVTATMLADETRDRELRPLRAISDNYEKIVLSMDQMPLKDFDGIKCINLLDFLLSD